VVLLLHAGDDIEHRVHAVGRRRHRQAAGGPVRAVDHHVLLRQRHLHPVEQQRHGRPLHRGVAEARVEPAQRRHGRAHAAPDLVAHRRVRRRHQSGEHRAGVQHGAGAGRRVESQRGRRDGHHLPAHADAGHVHVVERRPVRVRQQRRRLDALRLALAPEPQRAGEVEGLEAREAVREGGLVHVFGLGQEGQRPAAEPEEPLRRRGRAGGPLQAAEGVGLDDVVGDGEGVLGQRRHQRGVRVGEAEAAGLAVERARRVGRLRAQRRPAGHRAVRGGGGRVEGRGGGAARAAGAGDPRGVVAGVHGEQELLRRRAEAGAHHVSGRLQQLPPRRDGRVRAAPDGERVEVQQPRRVARRLVREEPRPRRGRGLGPQRRARTERVRHLQRGPRVRRRRRARRRRRRVRRRRAGREQQQQHGQHPHTHLAAAHRSTPSTTIAKPWSAADDEVRRWRDAGGGLSSI
jgi:hypothetical protein